MKMQIVSCPHCGTILFDDTSECHGCGHVLDHQSAPAIKARPLPIKGLGDGDMEACVNCGEMCRTGLVRCWNCSAFLRPEIEASYRKMRESGRYEVEHVELPIIDATHVTEEDSLRRRVSTPDSFLASHPYAVHDSAGGDDFELSGQLQLGDDDDETFDLNEDLLLLEQPADYVEQSEPETFQLQASSEETFSLQELPALEELPAVEEPPVQNELVEPPVRDEAGYAIAEAPPAEPAAVEPPPAPEPPREDELLKIAADEEQDIQRVRKSLRSKDTFVIFCPQGCRIRVKERHRGMSGKCPRCQSEFVVPRKPLAKKTEYGMDASAAPVLSSRYKKWITDLRLHTVEPLKLRIKADSLLNECQAVDVGFSDGDVLIATLLAGKFGANPKKIPPLRQAMLDHFLNQGTVETLTVAAKKVYPTELLAMFTLAQPTPAGTESLFADIPVFGTNRIAVRIPKMADDTHARYLSFCLSEFRSFVEGLLTICGIEGFGDNAGIPLTDSYAKRKCHFSEAAVLELAQINYYEKDPAYKLEVSGWRCAACGIVISEAARLEKKFGGANGKAIAKTKCPKCTQKFGSLPLYQLAGATEAPAAGGGESETTAS